MLLLLAACTPDPADKPLDSATGDSDTATTDTDTDTLPDPSLVCAELGLPVRDWQDGEETTALNGHAADFTLPTTEGDWNFRERWSGCDSYLFIQDEPEQATGWPKELWQRDEDDLLEALPRNVEIFFISTLFGSKADDAIAAMQDEMDTAYGQVDEELAAYWPSRIHYVTTPVRSLDNWLGDVLRDPGWGVGIDRFQTIRYIGSYADPERYEADYGWFAPNLSMVANEAVYYNFEAERDEAMQAEGAAVVPILSGTVAGSLSGTVELPDARGFDTLTVDTAMRCGGVGEYGYCPAWDYMAYLFMTVAPDVPENPGADTPCAAGTETMAVTCMEGPNQLPDGVATCNAEGTGFDVGICPTEIEVGRWITTYHREGRWVYDISAMLPFVAQGGSRTFRYETSGPYTLDVSFRYADQGKAERPTTTRYLVDAGKNGIPVTVDIPASAKKVELATVISQHGSDSEYCGEFCNIEHRFIVNGNTADEVVRDFPEAGNGYGCMDLTAEGTIPNQYGTWWYGRGGWCPGKEVPTVMADITDQVVIGGSNTIEYQHWRNGDLYTGGATLRLQSWIVISE